MKIKQPELFAKMSNDNILFLVIDSCYNDNARGEEKIWIIPRLNLEEFKKVKQNYFAKIKLKIMILGKRNLGLLFWVKYNQID